MAKRRTYDEVRGRGDTDGRQREAEGETRRAGNTLCAHSYEFPAIKYHSKIARRNSIFVKWRLDALYTRAFVEATLLWGAPIIRNLDGCISYSAKETLRFQFLFADSNVLSLPTMQAKGLNI